MGTFKVVFSKFASRDLEKIVSYIAQDNPEAAERFGLSLAEKAISLKDPLIADNGRKFSGKPGVQRIVYGNYVIVYRVFRNQGKVRVLRFWHSFRDRENIDGL